jgi:quinol monooxygenase YgiN
MDREFVISEIRRVAKPREPCPARSYSRGNLRNSSLSGWLAGALDARFGPRLRLMLYVVVATAIMATTLAESAYAQDSAVYLAIYVDVMPNEKVSGAALLERYRDASRREDGNLRSEVLHEIGRPDRFAMLEVWKDKAALENHDKAASGLRFREGLNAVRSAPYDVRVHSGIDVGPPRTESRNGTIYVLTHVDITPDRAADALALLKVMRVDTSREQGNIAYEVLQQANLANHFTLVEEWTDRKALDAHIIAGHTRLFRERLSPMQGAPYDERLYRVLN